MNIVKISKDYSTDLKWLENRYNEAEKALNTLMDVNRDSIHDNHGKVVVPEELIVALRMRMHNLSQAYKELKQKAEKA